MLDLLYEYIRDYRQSHTALVVFMAGSGGKFIFCKCTIQQCIYYFILDISTRGHSTVRYFSQLVN